MEDKQVGAEMKAALGELRQLATQLVNSSRDWIEHRRQDMNQHNKYGAGSREQRGEREQAARGYGEGYGTASMQNRTREEDWDDDNRAGGRDDSARWARGRETDADVRNQYGQSGRGGQDPGGYSQRGGGRERSGFNEYASGQREYGRAFDDSDFGAGRSTRSAGAGRNYRDDGESGYYAQGAGEYSQGYGRERDLGSVYGPEDFSQRYQRQGDVFGEQGYGEGGQYAGSRSPDSARQWNERDSRSVGNQWRGGEHRGYGSERSGARDAGSQGYGGQDYGRGESRQGYGGQRYASQGDYGQPRSRAGGYGLGDYGQEGRSSFGSEYGESGRQAQQSHRGRGPRGYTRSDERITEDLNERLTDDHQLDASEIQVSVSNGVATLSGTVEQRWLKHRAEDIAESCSGINDVRNDIRVRGSGGSGSGSGSGSETMGASGGASSTMSSSSSTADQEASNRNRGATAGKTTASGASTPTSGGNTH